nr:hypothetical protein [Streptomyces sp. SID4913]
MTGSSRVTVYVIFGVVFGYATHHLDERRLGDVAVVGPLTPGVEWGRLWQMARHCERPTAGETELAQWVLTQATRAFVCGSDRIAHFQERRWKLEPVGKCVRFNSTYANRDQLWTGNMTIDGLAPDLISERHTLYPA